MFMNSDKHNRLNLSQDLNLQQCFIPGNSYFQKQKYNKILGERESFSHLMNTNSLIFRDTIGKGIDILSMEDTNPFGTYLSLLVIVLSLLPFPTLKPFECFYSNNG